MIVGTLSVLYYCLKLLICSLLMDCGEGLNLLGIWRMHPLRMRISKRALASPAKEHPIATRRPRFAAHA